MKIVHILPLQNIFLKDFDKAFPPTGFDYKKVSLRSLHAKQMCWEESGGSFNTIVDEVRGQLQQYLTNFDKEFTTKSVNSFDVQK